MGPYYLIAQEKTNEAVLKIKSVSEAAVVKLEEYVPGAKKQLNNLGENIVKVSNLAIVKVQTFGGQAQATVLDVINGKITFCCIKEGAMKQVTTYKSNLWLVSILSKFSSNR